MQDNMIEKTIAGMKCWVDAQGRIYSECTSCGSLVRVNKPFFGSLHLCVDDNTDLH